MGRTRRLFTREFKLAAMRELDTGKPIGYVARHLEVSPNALHRWRRELREQPATAFAGSGERLLSESREAELERKIGQMAMENDFLKKLLSAFEERASENESEGGQSMKRSARKRGR